MTRHAVNTHTAARALSMKLTYEARREPTGRTVTESRLLGLIRWGRTTASLYAEGAAADTICSLKYRVFYVCRAVQTWQLTPHYFVTAWIDSGAEGVHLFWRDQGAALGKFALLCDALARRHPPQGNGYYTPSDLDPTQEGYDE
jgi:hypothetical protein